VEMSEMTRAEFLGHLLAEREHWETLLDQVEDVETSRQQAEGEWSVKDVIAHVTWHEREMLEVARQRALVGSDLWDLPTDQRNAAIYEHNRDRPLSEVLDEARSVYPQLLAALEGLSDEDFTIASRYARMPTDWLPWKLFAENTYEHYRDHIVDLRS
jgi:hypothetical protein